MPFSKLLCFAVALPVAFSADYNADLDPTSSTVVSMLENNDGTRTSRSYSVAFTVPATSTSACFNPTLSSTFQDIDYSPNNVNERMTINLGSTQLASCFGSTFGPGHYGTCQTETCLSGYDLGVGEILPSESLDLTVVVGSEVDPNGCYGVGNFPILKSDLTVTCNAATPIGQCIGGSQHEITVASALAVDPAQCGLGCFNAASLQECNDACYKDATCEAYVYAPDQSVTCALFDTTTPVRRSTNQIMCEDCAFGVSANSVPANINAIPATPAQGKTVKDLYTINYELLFGLNAAVSALVSLVVVGVVLAICWCSMQNKGHQYHTQIKMAEEDEDV